MKIVIDAEAKEIAELLLALEARPEEKIDAVYEITCPFCEQAHQFVLNESSLGAASKVNPDLVASGFYVARKVVQD